MKSGKSMKRGLIIGSIILLVVLLGVFSVFFSAEGKQGTGNVGEIEPGATVNPNEQSEGEKPSIDGQTSADGTSTTSSKPSSGLEKTPSTSTPESSKNESGYIDGQVDPVEPTYVNGILVVNKKTPLPSTYNKGEDPVAKEALFAMLAAGEIAGFEYVAFSGYRSYEYQTSLYNRYVNRDGKNNADRYSARPGYSEHQTGLAFDIGEKNQEDLWLTSEFGETPAGTWLMENAHQFGFILRYPEGKEAITGFMYESWHYRYVGIEVATKVFNEQVTLEEYLEID